jgi:hypothetical protein
VNVVRTFIRVDRFGILRVAHHIVLTHDAVAAMNITCRSRNVECLAAIVALYASYFRGYLHFFEQLSNAERSMESGKGSGD